MKKSSIARLVGCSVAAGLAVSLVAGCKSSSAEDEKGTKVLMIGNSFSICLLHHLPQVAADRGVELDLASLYIGGCSLERHWKNVLKDGDGDFRPYTFGRNDAVTLRQGACRGVAGRRT